MGLDLTLLVVDGPSVPYAHIIIEYGRRYDLFDTLDKMARTLPDFKLSSYVSRVPDGSMKGEPCYGTVEDTPYGDKLTYVTAEEFLKAATEHPPRHHWAKAACAYLKELPPNTWIGLYYH